MANVTHKPVDVRSKRRRRHIVVVDHLRQRYGCTAAQCMDVVLGLEKKIKSLEEQNAKQRDENIEQKRKLEAAQGTIKDMTATATERAEYNQAMISALEEKLMEANAKLKQTEAPSGESQTELAS